MKKNKLLTGALYTVMSFVAMFLPFAILFYIKRDVWLQESGMEVSIGVMIGLVYGILVMRGALKEVSKNASILISMSVVLGIIWFLDGILDDLFWVILSLIVGFIFFIIIFALGKRDIEYYKAKRNERARVEARREAQAEISGV